MEKLSKPISLLVDGSIVSFDEPRDSFQYDIYVDDRKVTTIDSKRYPNFIGTDPDRIGKYYDSVTVHLLFDVPIKALYVEYSLNGFDWLEYNDAKGIILNGTDTGDVQDIFYRGFYLETNVPIDGTDTGKHAAGFQVLKGYPITYSALNPKQATYILQPTICYATEETVFSVSTIPDVTEQATKLYYITNVNATNCTLQIDYNEEHTLATCRITKPTGNVSITVGVAQSNYYNHNVSVTGGAFSPNPFNCVYYQINKFKVLPSDGFALPQREDIYISGADTDDSYDFSYEVGEGTTDYAIIQFVPNEETCNIIITCKKVGA